jgi:sec-independent protein translocase protein TatB
MFDIGWTELLLIGIVALIVVGPKDLPVMFRTLGRFTAKLRAMGREFTRAMDQAADESGVKDVARDIRAATDLRKTGLDTLKDAATKFENWDPKRTSPTAARAAATGAAAAAPAAAEPAERGAYTQALAEAQAARKAERVAAATAATGAAAGAPAAPVTAATGAGAGAPAAPAAPPRDPQA